MNAIFFALALAAVDLPSGTWALDRDRSVVAFTVLKHGERVDGRFRDFTGRVTYDANDPSRSSIEWRVRVASVKTAEPGRDRSLRGRDFFDAAHFPEMTFVARGVQPSADGTLRFTGTITIRGRSRPLTVEARPVGLDPNSPIFSTRFDLDRFEFDLEGGPMMRTLISRNVQVRLVAVGARP